MARTSPATRWTWTLPDLNGLAPKVAIVMFGCGCRSGTNTPPAQLVDPVALETDRSADVVLGDSDLYLVVTRAAGAITGAIEDARRCSPIPEDAYLSPDEMLRDLRGHHGAECDRSNFLDRAMIHTLDSRR